MLSFFFSCEYVEVILHWLNTVVLPKRVVCIGCPRIHEAILEKGNKKMKSLLLDIDDRYSSYFPHTFLHYNMANSHFLGKSSGKNRRRMQNIFRFSDCILMDPPYSLRADVLKKSIQLYLKIYSSEKKNPPVFILFFPFNLKNKVDAVFTDNDPFTLKMLDYRIDYDRDFHKDGKKELRKISSPGRIFTNFSDPGAFTPPPCLSTAQQYRFCSDCKYYVHITNFHCQKCNQCVVFDGKNVKHCFACKKCVKVSWKHCEKCGVCQYSGTHQHFKKKKRTLIIGLVGKQRINWKGNWHRNLPKK